MAFELGWQEIPRFTSEAIAALEAYPWPGNVRELKNLVERAVYRSDTPLIKEVDFNPFRCPDWRKSLGPIGAPVAESGSLGHTEDLLERPLQEAVRDLEIRLLKKALRASRNHQQRAAQLLGLTYHQFRGLYRKYRKEIE
jgi:psp operon transcriptional activator